MKKNQVGLTLVEVIVALVIMSSILAGTAALIDRTSNDTRLAVASQHLKTVGDAATAYIKDNYSAVMAKATATTPALIRVSDLIAGGYLQSGFNVANTFGQNTCVLALEPSANNITALVITEGGTTLDDLSVGSVAGVAGAAAGGIYSTATTTVRGAMGGWSMALGNFGNANHLTQHCDASAGVATLATGHPAMALWFADGDSTSGFLYRSAVPGRPELNQMQTTLDMNGNVIDNAATLKLNTVVTNGTACTTNGVIARDTNGAVMSCQSGAWAAQGSAYWKDPVANIAALPTCNASAAYQTRIVQTSTQGSVPRAYTCTGASWSPLGVDDEGTLTLGGTIIANGSTSGYGALTIKGEKNGWSGINFKTAGDVNIATLMMNSNYSGFFTQGDNAWRYYVDNTGNSIQPGQVTATTFNPQTVATSGAACTSDGVIAKSSTGLTLSCQSGVWAAASGGGVQGSMCGFTDYYGGGYWQNLSSCQGLYPGYTGCPSGYTTVNVGASYNHYFYSCMKTA